ncbi:FUSC family protein [Nocardia sp. NPDC004711]
MRIPRAHRDRLEAPGRVRVTVAGQIGHRVGYRRSNVRWMRNEVWDCFSAFDPGLVRLCGAATTVGGVLLTLMVLAVIGPPASILVAAAWSSMVTGFTVSDPRSRDQAVTLVVGVPVSVVALILGSVLVPYRIASDLVLLLFIFSAMYVRRYGPRGSGLGDFAFQHFFMAQFVHATLAQIPSICVVVVLAIGCSGLVRFGIVRATPQRTLKRHRRAFRARLGAMIDAMIDVARAQPSSPAADRAICVLHRRSARLHQAALLIQPWLEIGIEDQRTARLVQRRIAEAEVAAEQTAILLLRALYPQPDGFSTLALHLPGTLRSAPVYGGRAGRDEPADPAVAQLLDELRDLRLLVARTTTSSTEPAAMISDRLLGYSNEQHLPTQITGTMREVYRALGELARAMLGLRLALGTHQDDGGEGEQTASCRAELEAEDAATQADEADNDQPTGFRRPTTRAAFQVTVGTAIAIVGGELVSADHWYWAMITCWVVFINTSSLGEVLIKGYRRLFGTMAGVAAGTALVALVAGHTTATFALMIICMFGAFFIASVSYLLMSLLITSMVGLLYALLGTYSDAVLILRIEETALGIAAGLVAALLVLPAHTRRRTEEKLAHVLEHMREVITEVVTHITGGPSANPLDAARELDTALDAYRTAVQPLIHPASPLRTQRSRVRYILGVLETCAYHLRSLATASELRHQNSQIFERRQLMEVGKQLDDNLAALAEFVQNRNDGHSRPSAPDPVATTIRPITRPPDLETEPDAQALRHLRRIEASVLSLAHRSGYARTDDSGTDVSCRPEPCESPSPPNCCSNTWATTSRHAPSNWSLIQAHRRWTPTALQARRVAGTRTDAEVNGADVPAPHTDMMISGHTQDPDDTCQQPPHRTE